MPAPPDEDNEPQGSIRKRHARKPQFSREKRPKPWRRGLRRKASFSMETRAGRYDERSSMTKLLTQFAAHANTIAETFRAAFSKTQLGDCLIEMSAPEESTRGGHFGLQHVMLRNKSGMAIVAASVQAKDKKAELRSYDVVAKLHAERFKRPPTFTEADYNTFLGRATPVFTAFGLQVTTVSDLATAPLSQPPGPMTEESSPAAQTKTIRFAIIVVAILVVGGAALLWGKQMLGG
jgi:hypothetical protein